MGVSRILHTNQLLLQFLPMTISYPNFVLQALKLLHHSPEFLPFVVFLSSPGSTALRNQLATSTANHVSNGQNGACPGILSSVCPLSSHHPPLFCPLSQSMVHIKPSSFSLLLCLYTNPEGRFCLKKKLPYSLQDVLNGGKTGKISHSERKVSEFGNKSCKTPPLN